MTAGYVTLEAAFTYLSSRPDVNAGKIGSIGWCMGGGWSLSWPVDQPKLAACVVNYGSLPSEPALVAKIKAPVQGNFGADDQGIPPKRKGIRQPRLKTDGKVADIKIYGRRGPRVSKPQQQAGLSSRSNRRREPTHLGLLPEISALRNYKTRAPSQAFARTFRPGTPINFWSAVTRVKS